MKVLIGVIIIVLAFLFLANIGIKKQEKMECQRWATQEKEYPLFEYTSWQLEQCEHYKIGL